MQWWNPTNKQCWEFEQLGIKVRLLEWELTIEAQPTISTSNLIHTTQMKFWKKAYKDMISEISVSSFTFHPQFEKARRK